MNTQALLEALEVRGIQVHAVDGFLQVDAPRGMLTATLRETLANHKDDLVDALRARPLSPAGTDPAEPSRWARRAAALLSRIDDDELRVELRDVFEETAAFLIRDGYEEEEYEEGYEDADEEHDRYTQNDDDEYESEYENEDEPEQQPMSAEEEEHPDLYEEEWPGAPTERQALEMMRAVMNRREVRRGFADG